MSEYYLMEVVAYTIRLVTKVYLPLKYSIYFSSNMATLVLRPFEDIKLAIFMSSCLADSIFFINAFCSGVIATG